MNNKGFQIIIVGIVLAIGVLGGAIGYFAGRQGVVSPAAESQPQPLIPSTDISVPAQLSAGEDTSNWKVFKSWEHKFNFPPDRDWKYKFEIKYPPGTWPLIGSSYRIFDIIVFIADDPLKNPKAPDIFKILPTLANEETQSNPELRTGPQRQLELLKELKAQGAVKSFSENKKIINGQSITYFIIEFSSGRGSQAPKQKRGFSAWVNSPDNQVFFNISGPGPETALTLERFLDILSTFKAYPINAQPTAASPQSPTIKEPTETIIRNSKRIADLRAIQSAIEFYYNKFSYYPFIGSKKNKRFG